MNKKEHINNTILDFDTTLNILFDEYELDISLPIEKCLSNESIKDIIPTEENTIFDKLDSVYYKGYLKIILAPSIVSFGSPNSKINPSIFTKYCIYLIRLRPSKNSFNLDKYVVLKLYKLST